MWWQDNWRDTLVYTTTGDGATSRHLFQVLTRTRKQCEARPKTRSSFHIVSSHGLTIRHLKKGYMTGLACRRVLPVEDDECTRGVWVTIYPPGRHWLDSDIQHSWHRKNSAPHWRNKFQGLFRPCILFPLFPPCSSSSGRISCLSWGRVQSPTNRATLAWKKNILD